MRFSQTTVRQSADVGLQRYFLTIYQYMGLGLALTGLIPFVITMLPPSARMTLLNLSTFSMFGTIGVALYFNFAFQRMSASTAQFLFWVYAALMGLGLAVIPYIYSVGNISSAFFVTAGTFGSLSIYGHMTQRDLTSVGSFCTMGLWGVIIASLVNFFLKNSALDFVVSVITVAVFVGLTAYDTQRLRHLYYQLPHDQEIRGKAAVMGALTLYLDVINIFLGLLRLLHGSDRR